MAGIYTVTEINSYIRNMFIRDYVLSNICIKGEVSNLKYHSSGHIYFTLKDEGSSINAVMFASRREGLTFRLRDGQQVEVKGRISVYEKSGSYQLYASDIRLSGRGELYERFEKLKNELAEMGMFDECYKKPIPEYAMRVGIVTSDTGAAIRDIMNIAGRRNPYVELVLYPALVQGDRAKESIVRGIECLDRLGLDIIIVGRGGGSIEDLWAFNEEEVARAVFYAETPIISAVGHETDFTITDFVADLRAPTPSAAAELAVFDFAVFSEELSSYEASLLSDMERVLTRKRAELSEKRFRLAARSPESRLAEKKRELSDMKRELGELIRDRTESLKTLAEERRRDISDRMDDIFTARKHRLELLTKRLELLSPLLRISGGYGYLVSEEGRSIRSVGEVKKGDRIRTYIKDGVITGTVEDTERLDPGSRM